MVINHLLIGMILQVGCATICQFGIKGICFLFIEVGSLYKRPVFLHLPRNLKNMEPENHRLEKE